MKLSTKQLKKIWDTCLDYETRTRKAVTWMEEIFDWRPVLSLPHPIDIIDIINPELYDILSYILFECDNERMWIVEYPNWDVLELQRDFDSLVKYCEYEWFLCDKT